jgi:hypothetical protein
MNAFFNRLQSVQRDRAIDITVFALGAASLALALALTFVSVMQPTAETARAQVVDRV